MATKKEEQHKIIEYLSESDKKRLQEKEAEKSELEILNKDKLVNAKFKIVSKDNIDTAYGNTILIKIGANAGFFANEVIAKQGLDFDPSAYYTIVQRKAKTSGRLYFDMVKLD